MQAGVISFPVVSAAVRIHGGQVMMAQANQDLPEGVREALGDSPEVRGVQVTDKAGAGMADAPKHHVMPQEHREWFEWRDPSISQPPARRRTRAVQHGSAMSRTSFTPAQDVAIG